MPGLVSLEIWGELESCTRDRVKRRNDLAKFERLISSFVSVSIDTGRHGKFRESASTIYQNWPAWRKMTTLPQA